MKQILFYFLLALPLFAQPQNHYELKLSHTVNESRMGIWAKGDYTIYIELGALEASFRNTAKGLINGGANKNEEDSIGITYNLSVKRYLKAADELRNAGKVFDLRKLVIYYGAENEKENLGSSFIVENAVRQLLENGTAEVYYKGNRIYNLIKRDEPKGEGADFGYSRVIYFDDVENYIFKYYEHLGW